MKKAGCLLAGVLSLVLAIAAIWFVSGWWGSAEIEEDTNFIVPSGASLTSVAEKLAEEGVIADPEGFLLRAKILGSSDPILAGEFLLPAGASSARRSGAAQAGILSPNSRPRPADPPRPLSRLRPGPSETIKARARPVASSRPSAT